MMRTARKAFAIAALGVAVAFSATSANAAQTIDIKTYIDDQGGAKDGTGGEKAVTTFSIDGVIISAGAGTHTLEQGAYVNKLDDGWSAYHDHLKAGMGVTQKYETEEFLSDGTTPNPDYLQSVNTADDNTQGAPDIGSMDAGEVLKISLASVGPNYRIDELYFRNDGHTPTFDAGKTVGVSTAGPEGPTDGVAAGDGSANTWTSYTLTSGVANNDATIGALLGIPTGGIILTAGDALYLAFTNQQWYLSGFSFTILNDQLNPVPLPAGLLLLLSGLMGLGFLGRFRQKTA